MSRTIYKNARILLGDAILENGTIVVEHRHVEFTVPAAGEKPKKVKPVIADKIAYVGEEHAAEAEGDEVIDLKGCTVLPGLIDADTRLDTLPAASDDYVDNIGTAFRTYLALRNAGEALNAGVTTVKAVGMPNNIDIALKTAISKTMFFGPDVMVTGPVFGVTAGKGHEKYGMIMCSGEDEFRAQVRIHVSRGVDGVTFQMSGDRLKTLGGEYYPEMSRGEINAMVKHVRGAEKPVAVNANGDPSVRMAIDAGVDIIQQGYRISDDLLREMAEKGIYYVPCLVSTVGMDIHEEHKDVVRRAIKAGVKIAAGTEILPGECVDGTSSMQREIELLAELGMAPADALAAATSVAAACVKSKAGVLAAGRAADFIVVDGRPDENIADIRKIAGVVKGGRLAFLTCDGETDRRFSMDGCEAAMTGGTAHDYAAGALQGVKDPQNYNIAWNLMKEI